MNLPLSPAEFRSQEWPVSEDYRIEGEWIVPVERGGSLRSYRPQDWPELPFEIAKLAGGSDHALLRFVRKWGLLGYYELQMREDHRLSLANLTQNADPSRYPVASRWELREREVSRPGPLWRDPAAWVRRQARELAICVSLVERLQARDGTGIAREIESYLDPNDQEYWTWNSVFALHFFGLEDRPIQDPMSETLASRPLEAGQLMLEHFVNDHIGGLTPEFEVEASGATIGYKYTAVIEVAYFHVARLAVEKARIDRCQQCGAPFKKTHGHQLYCPKGPFDSESRCSYRQRYRRSKRFKSGEAKHEQAR